MSKNKLAINGGEPVRDTWLYLPYPGAQLYDESEAKLAFDACMSKSPFRYYGINYLGMVEKFEKSIQTRMNVKNALAVTSGTAAVVVALKAAGIGPGDKVIVPSCTFVATAGAVLCAGAVPVFADIDDTMHIDPKKLSNVVDKYTKVIITVPLAGAPCQIDEITEFAKAHNLIVIEDVAQSMGSSYKGKAMGTWGDLGTYSLQMNKILTTGEGGAVVTDSDVLYERAVRYHDQGQFRKDPERSAIAELTFPGQNYRMSEITGAVANAQMERLDFIIDGMRKVKKTIKEEIKNVPGLTFRRIIDEEGDVGASIIMYAPNNEKALEFIKAMNAENIGFYQLYGGKPVYMNPQIFTKNTVEGKGFPYNQFDEEIIYTEDMCPTACDLASRMVMLSLSPVFTEKDIEDVINAVKKVSSAIFG